MIAPSVKFSQKNKNTPVTPPKLPMDANTGLYTYNGVIEVPGTAKDELYKRAFAWANTYYKNPGDVIREKKSCWRKIADQGTVQDQQWTR